MGNITLLMSSENLYIEDEPGHYAYHFEQFVKKYAVILQSEILSTQYQLYTRFF